MAEILHFQGEFCGQDGTQRYWQAWSPKMPKASLVIVHGYAEYSGRYADFALHLANQNFAVYSFDLGGHGHSEGERGYVNSLKEAAADVAIFLKTIRQQVDQQTANQQTSNRPLFLLGHSMGGAIATLFALQYEPEEKLEGKPEWEPALLQGLILSGPFLKVKVAALTGPLSILSQLAPRLPTIRLDSSAISQNAEVVQRYRLDPLVYHGRLPAQTVVALLQATQEIQTQQQRLGLPLLILHGTADRLAPIAGSYCLYAQARSPDKTLKAYAGLYHEVLNESEPQVLQDLLTWLEERL